MLNSDVDGVKVVSRGILITDNVNNDYAMIRLKKLEEQRQKEEINKLKDDVAQIKAMLTKLLEKVQ